MGSGGGAQDGAGAAVLGAGPARAGAAGAGAGHRELAALPLAHLRARRRALRAEAEGAARWQGLLRARRDLLLALAVGVEDLRVPLEAACDGGPLDEHAAADLAAHDLTEPSAGLRELVLAGAGAGPGGLERELRDLAAAQRRLAGYALALQAELAAVTGALAGHYGIAPAAAHPAGGSGGPAGPHGGRAAPGAAD